MSGDTSSNIEPSATGTGIGPARTLVFAAACGLIVANLYFAQPLAGEIGRNLGLRAESVGLIVTVTQLGYAAGLVLLVPLGDLVENRRLISSVLVGAALGLAMMAFAPTGAVFLCAAFILGLSSVAAQILVPFAAQLAPEATRGRVVGNVMSGLMVGILLSRPIASMIADTWGWRTVFGASAVVTVALSAGLSRALPVRQPGTGLSYPEILRSLGTLLTGTPVLQRRAAYQATLFGAFSLFWTAVPLLLEGPVFHLTQRGIALYALAGAGGAAIAPVAGRLADRGLIRRYSGICMALVLLSFGIAWLGAVKTSISLLVVAAIILDLGVTANLVLGQRAIFSLAAEIRSRLNGIFIAIFFLGGATGSALAGLAYARGGWSAVTALGAGFAVVCLLIYGSEFTKKTALLR
jgi:predicted MFS family arabinose efflux permease